MANPDLPHEILLEIFSRIPTKSVGKCRTLSKYWKTHLLTNNFIKKHLIFRQQTIRPENLALTTQGDQLCVITSPITKDELLNNASGTDKWMGVLGSCNGLILICGFKGFILMNPITRKQVTIQPLVTPERKDMVYFNSVYGLGYDSCSDDHKIVRICSHKSINGDGLVMTFVDVYSVKNGVWKTVDGCYPYGGFEPTRYGFEGGAFVNGALHWIICSKEGYRSCIAALDLANEVFHEIPLPKEFVRQLRNDVADLVGLWRSNGVSVVGGCLLIVDNFGDGETDVWIMKEYGVAESWVRYRIVAEDGNWHSIVATLCYVGDGELLCLTSWDYLFVCDLKGGTVRKVVLGGWDAWFAHGMAFVDSLVPPYDLGRRIGGTVAN